MKSSTLDRDSYITHKFRYLIIMLFFSFLFTYHHLSGKAVAEEPFYSIQLDTFNNLDNAERSVQYLKDNGLNAFHVSEEISGGKWFRVYIGEFDNEDSARKAGAELLEKGIISYFKPLEINRGENSK